MNSPSYIRRKPSRRYSRNRTLLDVDCNIPLDVCETSSGYNKNDIMQIADNCGIDIYHSNGLEKTRKELCEDLAVQAAPVIPSIATLAAPPVNLPRIYIESELRSMKVGELREIARDLGIVRIYDIPLYKARKQDIIDEIMGMNPTPQPVLQPISLEDLELSNIVNMEQFVIAPVAAVDRNAILKNTKTRLLEMAEEYGITRALNGKTIKSQNKPVIVDAIVAHLEFQAQQMQPVIPPVIVEPLQNIISPVLSPSDVLNQNRNSLSQLLNFKEAKKCYPIAGVDCDTGDVCNINKTPGECISPEEAAYRQNRGSDMTFDYNGRTLIGKESSINSFRLLIDELEAGSRGGFQESKEDLVFEVPVKVERKPMNKKLVCDTCTYTNNPDSIQCMICQSDLTDEDIAKILPEGVEIVEVIPESTEMADIRNVEDILREIQNNDSISMEGIDEAKRKVLYCLGLLG